MALVDALVRQGKRTTSLDTPEDQTWGEIGGEFAAGLLPGVGQAMSMRDFERARREDSKLGMALAAVGMLPLGRIFKGGDTAVRKILTKADPKKDANAIDKFTELSKKSKASGGLERAIEKDRLLQQTGLIDSPVRGTQSELLKYHHLGKPRQLKMGEEASFGRMYPEADLSSLPSGERIDLENIIYRTQPLDPSYKNQHRVGGRANPAMGEVTLEMNPKRMRPEEFIDTAAHETEHIAQGAQPWAARGSNLEFEGDRVNRLRRIYADVLRRGRKDEAAELMYTTPEQLDEIVMNLQHSPGMNYMRNLGEHNARLTGTLAKRYAKSGKVNPYSLNPHSTEWANTGIVADSSRSALSRMSKPDSFLLDSDPDQLMQALKFFTE